MNTPGEYWKEEKEMTEENKNEELEDFPYGEHLPEWKKYGRNPVFPPDLITDTFPGPVYPDEKIPVDKPYGKLGAPPELEPFENAGRIAWRNPGFGSI